MSAAESVVDFLFPGRMGGGPEARSRCTMTRLALVGHASADLGRRASLCSLSAGSDTPTNTLETASLKCSASPDCRLMGQQSAKEVEMLLRLAGSASLLWCGHDGG